MSSGRWFRMYDAVLDDPKVQTLSDAHFRAWVNLMCIASRHDGLIVADPVGIAFSLRLSEAKARNAIETLRGAGLLDEVERGWTPHNWDKRQYKSDVSTERVQRFRKRHETVSVTPPESDSESDTDSERKKEPAAKAAPSKPNGSLFPETAKPKAKVKKKTRCPEGFPGEPELAFARTYWARECGRDDLQAHAEAEKFRDHHSKENKLSADWPASWRTWTRNAVAFNRKPHAAVVDQPRKIIKVSEASK